MAYHEWCDEWSDVILTPDQQLQFVRKVSLLRQDRHSVLPQKTPAGTDNA